ncbi:MAG: hypothetical protein ACRDVO_15885, partial [Jiangellaceae bacterium]
MGGRLRRWVQRHPVIAFVALAYTLSWLTWLPVLLGFGGAAAVVVGGLGPLVAALVVTRYTGDSVRAWARPIARWRVACPLLPLRAGLAAVGLVAAALMEPVTLLMTRGMLVGIKSRAEQAPRMTYDAIRRIDFLDSPVVAFRTVSASFRSRHLQCCSRRPRL